MTADDERGAMRERARSIADADAQRAPGPPARDDHGNPMGGFGLLLHPYRRWVLRGGVVALLVLGAWRLVASLSG